MWTKRKAMAEATAAMNSYRQQAEELQRETWEIGNDIVEFKKQIFAARITLAQHVLTPPVTQEGTEAIAAQWDCPQLIRKYHALISQRDAKIHERDALALHPTVVQRSALVEADDAQLKLEYHAAKEAMETAKKAMEVYHSEAFNWLYQRKIHESKAPTGFSKFWKFVTLETRKMNQYLAEVKSKHFRIYKDVVVQYEEELAEYQSKKASYDAALDAWNKANKLIQDFDQLNAWDTNFDSMLLESLAETLAQHIQTMSFDEMLGYCPQRWRQYVAEIHALTKKIEYATNLASYLQREEADRHQRVESINRVYYKWRRKPSGYVRGDKSKWLVTLPQMKQQGVRKRVGWSRGMRSSLNHFDDYGHYNYHYNRHYHTGSAFIAFDLFNHRSDYRMPYEGFCSGVIPELEEFRSAEPDASWVEEGIEEMEEVIGGDEAFDDVAEAHEEESSGIDGAAEFGAMAAIAAAMEVASEVEESVEDIS